MKHIWLKLHFLMNKLSKGEFVLLYEKLVRLRQIFLWET